jgi:hypothetical protein
MQQLADRRMADRVAHLLQLRRQPAQALARPAQRRHRIATRPGRDQPVEIGQQLRIVRHQGVSPAARPAHPIRRQRRGIIQLGQTAPDRTRCNPGRARHRRDPAIPGQPCFHRRKLAPTPFIQVRAHRHETLSKLLFVNHLYKMGMPSLRGTPEGAANSIIF